MTFEMVDGRGLHDGAARLVHDGLDAIAHTGRADLQRRLHAAGTRLAEPSTVVCVVGEFKQGKSSLVNALLGDSLLPVDDDLATSALTIVHHGDVERCQIHRRDGGEPVVETVAREQLSDFVTEAGNPHNVRRVERAEVALPHPLLARGLTFVDTPGMGGLGAGRTAATLTFLPYADALLLVSDASQELTASERSLLARATEACPTVLFCLTKTDLYPAWRQIADLDRRHLREAGIDARLVPLSSALGRVAVARGDETLDGESGIPALRDILTGEVAARSVDRAAHRAVDEVRVVLGQVRHGIDAELAALHPAGAGELERLTRTVDDLTRLEAGHARWRQVLDDCMTQLADEIGHDLRARMLELERAIEKRIGTLQHADEWEQLTRDVQTAVGELLAALFDRVAAGAASARADVLAAVADTGVSLPELGGVDVGVEIGRLWDTGQRDVPDDDRLDRTVKHGVTMLMDAVEAADVLGLIERLLPAAASVLAASPILLGAGLLFGGRGLVEQRRNRQEQQRQDAMQQMRRFLEDVELEARTRLTATVREQQQRMRDGLAAQLVSLRTTYEDAARGAAGRQAADQEQQSAMVARLEEQATRLDAITSRAAQLETLR